MENASSWDRWVTLFEDAGYVGGHRVGKQQRAEPMDS